MISRHILKVDVGTSSTKTSLWTETGQLVGHATSAYELQRAEPLWAEIDGDVWWRAVSPGASCPGRDAYAKGLFSISLCWLLGHPPGKSQVFGVKRMEGYLGLQPLFIT